MKKHLAWGLLCALLLTACTREMDSLLELFDASPAPASLTALTESQPGSRTTIQNGTEVFWEPGDELSVFWNGSSGRFVSELSAPEATATFYGPLTGWKEGTTIWAVYPYAEDAVFNGEGITTTLPARQTARAGSFAQGMNLSVARAQERTLQFYNVGGGVRFSVASDGIRRVVLESLGGENLAGKVRIAMEDGLPVVREVTEGSRFVTLLPPDGGSFRKDTWYFITAVPGVLEKGFRLQFYKETTFATLTRETPVTLKRGIFGSLERADDGLEYQPLPDLETWTTDKTLRGAQYEEEGGGEDAEVVQMPPNALFVMDDLNQLLVSFDEENGRITYREGTALTEANIQVGDVLYSMPVEGIAPEGYILRVTSFEKKDGRICYDVEPAGLADAFDYLSTNVPIDVDHLSEDCITFYDILEQPDQSAQMASFDANATAPSLVATRSVFDVGMDLSAVTDTNKLKIKVDSEKASISYVLVDGDDNLKTTYDQIRLVIRFEYAFGKDCFHFDFDASRLFLSMDFTPSLGASCGFEYGGKGTSGQILDYLDIEDASPQVWDAGTARKVSTMQQKLMGKKIKILSYDLTKHGLVPKAVKAIVRPTIELYAYFNLSLDGNLEVSFGLEKTPWNLHAENIPYTSMPNLTRMIPKPDHLTPTAKFIASVDFKGSTGLGIGVVARLPKVSEKISYKDPKTKQNDVPWMGFFCEWGLNAKGKAKSWVDLVSGKLHSELSVDVYNELSGYLEAFAHLKSGLLFNPKVDLIKTRWPETSLYNYKYSWETEQRFPVPILLSPFNREAVEGNSVSLQWKIPNPDIALHSADNPFRDLQYQVFAGTDKEAVDALSPSALAGTLNDPNDTTRFDLKSVDFPVERMQTYWWKVVCKNGEGKTYESPLSSFDCGYDGKLVFQDDLSRWLADHFEALGDVYVQEDGSILRTRSNINALAALTNLEIMDGGIYYHIKSIDDLLQQLPALQTLDCRNNKITSLDLSHNPKLTSLVCNGNQIGSLGFSQNPLLTNLSCKENQLTALNLNALPRLENINCAANPQLKTLVFSDCQALRTIRCDDCKIDRLDLGNNPHIVDLYAAGNHLDTLDITTCPNLIRLDVYSQSTELLKLRLLHAQMNGFALFKRHFNMEFDYAENLVTWDPVLVTQKSATIPATLRSEGQILQYGILYFTDDRELTLSNSNVVYAHDREGGYYTVTLTGLRPGTEYFVRGFAVVTGDVYYGNTVRFRTLSGNQKPEMIVSPNYIEFGDLSVGETQTKRFSVYNDGDAPLVFHLESDGGPFSWSPDGEMTVEPLGSQEVSVTFAPQQGGAWDEFLHIVSNASAQSFPFSVSGTASEGFQIRAIDLGLPSGIKWANCDVGAESLTDVGALYAWGELETKETFKKSNYRWYDNGYTKYCFDPAKGRDGYADWNGVLNLEDDVARQQWGGPWRLPTEAEWQELIKGCQWSCDTIQGIPCAKGTSLVTGASILFPLNPPNPREGSYNWRNELWTSSLTLPSYIGVDNASTHCARHPSLVLGNNGVFNTIYLYNNSRYYGKSIRPVQGFVNKVILDRQTASIPEGGCLALKETVLPHSAPDHSVNWRSSNPSVAHVTPEGVVIGLQSGTATITVCSNEGNVQDTCEVTVTAEHTREAIDLGLSVKWSSFDLGAVSGWAHGDGYRWAEIDLPADGTPYKWERGSYRFTKYSEADHATELELEDDAAYQIWGDKWRTPSQDEWQELLGNCDQHFVSLSDYFELIVFVSKINGNAVMFSADHNSLYWSASLNGQKNPHSYRCAGGTVRWIEEAPGHWYIRSDVANIRPVYDEVFRVPVKGVVLDRNELNMNFGGSASLNARLLPNNATNQHVSWSSSNPEAVTVSDNGQLHFVGEGSAVITVRTEEGAYTATCSISVIPAPEAVDLGLSVRWASFDIGSSNPEVSGSSFRWGETLPTDKTQASWLYDWFLEDNYLKTGKLFLELEHDTARVLLGSPWRMPTKDEWQELQKKCIWTKIRTGFYEVHSKTNDNRIYFNFQSYHSSEMADPANTSSWYYYAGMSSPLMRGQCSSSLCVRAVCDLESGN